MTSRKSGAMTVVFKYDDFEVFRNDPIYSRIFALMEGEKTPDTASIRVTAIAHDDEMTRMDFILWAAAEFGRNSDDLADAIEFIYNADPVSELTYDSVRLGGEPEGT
jgi:hypothetical protein